MRNMDEIDEIDDQYFIWLSLVRCNSRYHVPRHPMSLGTKSGTKIFKFMVFTEPSDQNEQYHSGITTPNYYPKYAI